MSKPHSREFIARAVRQCEEGSMAEVARNLGVRYGTLYDWVKRAERNKQRAAARTASKVLQSPAPTTTAALQAENERLRRELEETKKQLEFAKKAAAFFAQQNK